ncbi:MAG TPA: hypothetical protein DCG75_08700 [Bacteroidales bacterium]|nr:hypothetical protein [Bacteroidales bacterium]
MGKNKYIETPDKMWEYFQSYKKEVKGEPIIVKDWVGKDAIDVYREKERPLTLEGFENWCSDNEIIEDLSNYFANSNDAYSDYSTICTRIRKSIRQDQIEGGMVGIYNPSITQRLNGLTDKKEIDLKAQLNIPTIPDIGNRK